jgi:hypothetical protein
MNERIRQLALQAGMVKFPPSIETELQKNILFGDGQIEKFAKLILANADELNRMTNTDPINKPFELNPKFVAKCDEIGRSRRQFQ